VEYVQSSSAIKFKGEKEALIKLNIVINNPTLNPLQKANIEIFCDDLSKELIEVEEKTKIYY
jgi:hypothetical protein